MKLKCEFIWKLHPNYNANAMLDYFLNIHPKYQLFDYMVDLIEEHDLRLSMSNENQSLYVDWLVYEYLEDKVQEELKI